MFYFPIASTSAFHIRDFPQMFGDPWLILGWSIVKANWMLWIWGWEVGASQPWGSVLGDLAVSFIEGNPWYIFFGFFFFFFSLELVRFTREVFSHSAAWWVKNLAASVLGSRCRKNAEGSEQVNYFNSFIFIIVCLLSSKTTLSPLQIICSFLPGWGSSLVQQCRKDLGV